MLTRVPWWGWFALVLITLYAIYNPLDASLYHMWVQSWPWWWSVKALLTLAILALLGVIIDATWRSIGVIGIVVVVTLLGLLLWVVADLGYSLALAHSAGWLTQLLAAIVLTVGLRWARVWRIVTGRTQVDEDGSHPDAAAR